MKIIKKILIFTMFLVPILIKAESYNYNDGVKEGNNYIKSTKYDTRGKYLIMTNQKFIMNDNGTLSANNNFYNGGFLNRLEFCISTGNTNCNGSSYLMIPASYWTLSGNSTSRYYVNNVSGLNIQSDTYSSGVRVTEFVKPQISVTGSGTYNNPWVFDETYLVNLRTNNKKLGYFGSESEKKSSESKYATNECLSGSGLCTNFDITVARGYANNTKDGCNLKLIKNGEKRGTSTVKTYEISDIKSDISCVAIFEEDKFTIKFDSNGGTGNMANKIATYGKNISLPNEFTRANYEFIGWNTAADGSGYNYSTNSFIFNSVAGEKGIDVNNNLTLYAQWKVIYTIAYIGRAYSASKDPCGAARLGIEDKVTGATAARGNYCGMVVSPNRVTHGVNNYSGFGWLTPEGYKWGVFANQAGIYYSLNQPVTELSQMTPLSVIEWSVKDYMNIYIYKINPVPTPSNYEFYGEVHTITTNINHGNWAQWSSGIYMIDNKNNNKEIHWGCYNGDSIVRGINFTGFGVILKGGITSTDAKCGLGNYNLYNREDNIYYSSKPTYDENDLTPLSTISWAGNDNKMYYIYKKIN